jgi:hypothetical protein
MTMTGIRPTRSDARPVIGFATMGQGELRAEDDRDLGVVKPYVPGVDRQEAEKGAVAEVHEGFDAGRDENRRCLEHLGDALPVTE